MTEPDETNPWLLAGETVRARPDPTAVNGGSNPYVRREGAAPVSDDVLDDDQLVGTHLWQTGVQNPAAVRARPVSPPTPEHVAEPTPDSIWFVGASGGVGVSTLTRLAGDGFADAGDFEPMLGARVFVVAATHKASLDAAAAVGRRLADGHMSWKVLGLVLVHDRAKLPAATVRRARAVGRMFPKYLTLPYVPAWRDEEPTRATTVRGRQVIHWLTKERTRR